MIGHHWRVIIYPDFHNHNTGCLTFYKLWVSILSILIDGYRFPFGMGRRFASYTGSEILWLDDLFLPQIPLFNGSNIAYYILYININVNNNLNIQIPIMYKTRYYEVISLTINNYCLKIYNWVMVWIFC